MKKLFTLNIFLVLTLFCFQQQLWAQCADPTGLNPVSSAQTSVEIGFTSTSGGTTTASVCPAGTVPPDASCITVSPFTNSGTVMGLTACTDYDAYVQDDCGAMGMSALVGPVNFQTANELAPACGATVTHPCAGIYESNEIVTFTLTPAAGMVVVMDFTYVDIETSTSNTSGDCGCGCWDRVTLSDGTNTSGPFCGEGNGDGQVQGDGTLPGTNLAAGDCFFSEVPDAAVTVLFESDGSVNETGFSFIFTCVPLATAEGSCARSLPTALVSFSGTPMEAGNKLSWKTAFEENTEWHIIERSNDGITWSEIGRVAGAGYSIQENTYQFMDEKPLAKSFYRVKFEDYNKTASYSTMLTLERTSQAFRMDKVFPNPATTQLTAQFESDKNTDVVVELTDLLGRVVYRSTFEANDGINSYELDVNEYAAGVYFLRIDNGTEVLTERILKK